MLRPTLLTKTPRDAFRTQSTQIFILQMMIKNFLFYAFSTFVNEFVAEHGPGHMCRVFGTVTLCGFVTCIPMCKFIFFSYGIGGTVANTCFCRYSWETKSGVGPCYVGEVFEREDAMKEAETMAMSHARV